VFSHGFEPWFLVLMVLTHGIVLTHGFLHMLLEGCLSYIKKAMLSFVTRVWRIKNLFSYFYCVIGIGLIFS
jgi:hypothetical protein